MTLAELKTAFPRGCKVELTAQAKSKGFARAMGETGEVQGHTVKIDLAENVIPLLVLWLDGPKRRRDCQPSFWERSSS